jgi:cytosine/adenosine deaminase-related metal-dependent hydrolase
MRLGSGFVPLMEYLREGIHVGLGVDGSASNDGSHMLAEVRQALLMARLRAGLMGASLSGEKCAEINYRSGSARNSDPAAEQQS